MKRILLIAILFGAITTYSQDTIRVGNWMITGKVSFNISQSYFSNWSAGGISSLTTVGKYTMSANYQKDRHSWTNWLDLALGYSLYLDVDPMKTDDKIEYITSYQYQLNNKNWSFTVLGRFATQFAKGYDYGVDSSTYISKFFAPAYADIGPGIMYKPNDWFLINVSPATGSWIIVDDQRLADDGSFGLEPAVRDTAGNVITHAKRVRTMFGAKMMMVINYEIVKNITVGTKLELFSDYLQNPQNIDVNWQVLIGLKVNDWLNVDLQTTLLYDDDVMILDKNGNIGPRTQFRQFLMISIGYAF
ncbi:MAG: DUF3078 domain-containing protein [Chlorobi bacterium]|nr:DUF3078 domain-containing protein [Chlorobiota bacterium]